MMPMRSTGLLDPASENSLGPHRMYARRLNDRNLSYSLPPERFVTDMGWTVTSKVQCNRVTKSWRSSACEALTKMSGATSPFGGSSQLEEGCVPTSRSGKSCVPAASWRRLDGLSSPDFRLVAVRLRSGKIGSIQMPEMIESANRPS